MKRTEMAFDSSYTALCSSVTLQSNKEGFFQQFTDKITNLVDTKWLNTFVGLPNEKKILKCLTDEKIRNYVLETLDNVQEVFRGKSTRLSQQRRQEAEHLYGNKKLEKSLLLYTQSVIRAPVAGSDNCEDGVTLALALWGRSAILFDLKRYQLCLDDVKLALQEKLPDEFKLNAYWRMVDCYVNLNLITQARISLKIMLKLTNTEKSSWADKVQQKLEELDLKSMNNTLLTSDHEQVLTGKKHEKFENASSKLQLAESNVAGKHFIAQEPINTGDTLLIEDPYVSCLSAEKFSSHCHHCLQRLETGIPCTTCSAVAFCSLKCRLAASKSYHKYECRYLDLLIGSGMSVLSFAALRIVTQQNMKYFVEALNNKDDHEYNQVQNLVTHDDKRTGVDFLHRTLMALFLLAVLKKSKYFLHPPSKMNVTNPQEILIGRILLRNLEVLQFNAHEIFEPVKFKNTNKPVKAFPIGVGLYRTASYFNHDCYPAVSRFFVGTKLFIKAIRPLGKTEAVGDNYGPVFTKHHFTERQQKLLSRYWFKCECCACLQNWPKAEALNEKVFKLKCKACDRLIIYEEGSDDHVCKNCFQSCNELFDEVAKLKNEIEVVKNNDESDDDRAQNLYHLQDSLTECLHPPHRIFNEIQEKLLQYWMHQGKVFAV